MLLQILILKSWFIFSESRVDFDSESAVFDDAAADGTLGSNVNVEERGDEEAGRGPNGERGSGPNDSGIVNGTPNVRKKKRKIEWMSDEADS